VADRVDVAVIGAGPAGTAAAIALRGLGRSVVIVDTARSPIAIGETLPPEATPLLQQLGVWDAFQAAGHSPAVCNESAWGDSTVTATSFIMSAYGRGWHLDRATFDTMLRDRATGAGAGAIDGRVCGIARNGHWFLTVDANGERSTLAAEWIVDATGRASWVAARLGVRRVNGPALTACAVRFERARDRLGDHDRTTLVETVPSGWFYTAPLPPSRRIAVCFTRPADAPRTLELFAELSAGTVHVRRRLRNYRPFAGPWLFAANSSALERPTGDGWLAAGDAACAHDPVSSYGIMSALGTGLHAAEAIDAALKGRRAAIVAFELRLRSGFEKYLRQLDDVYGTERRWPDNPFWRAFVTAPI
jgi:2-polyprenyl-6-methoxyphenol hydroxylase-like FAD-dependent oxidoreductase